MSTGPDGFVVVPSISTGVNIDNTLLTQSTGTAVERQRVDVPGPIWAGGDVMTALLIELRILSQLLAMAFNIQDDLNAMRNDLTIQTDTQ